MKYFNEVNAPSQKDFKLVSYCQIGRSLDLAKFAVASAIENAGMEFRKDFEICFVCWRTSEEVYEWLDENKYWHIDISDESDKGFVHQLYRGWSIPYELAYIYSNYCVPIATDHYFFPNWLLNLYVWAHPHRLISCTLIEPGPQTLHPMCNLGITTPEDFNYGLAERVFDEVYKDELVEDKYNGYYHLDHGIDANNNIRQDAMPFICSKEIWLKYGPMIPFDEHGTTGDSSFFDKVRHDGQFKCYRSAGSLSYHVGALESRRNANNG